jgi:hypothetical protein
VLVAFGFTVGVAVPHGLLMQPVGTGAGVMHVARQGVGLGVGVLTHVVDGQGVLTGVRVLSPPGGFGCGPVGWLISAPIHIASRRAITAPMPSATFALPLVLGSLSVLIALFSFTANSL